MANSVKAISFFGNGRNNALNLNMYQISTQFFCILIHSYLTSILAYVSKID